MILKETVKQQVHWQRSSVFTCFLDLSKAFERIEYSILIHMLHENHVPEFIINILCFIFSKSTADFISMAGHWRGELGRVVCCLPIYSMFILIVFYADFQILKLDANWAWIK